MLLIIITITLFSFQSKVSFQSDKQLNEIFSKSEIKEIENMVSYFDSIAEEKKHRRLIHFAAIRNEVALCFYHVDGVQQ